MVTAVVGANWGDEGKGKITDMLADEADIVIRFQGGANAGKLRSVIDLISLITFGISSATPFPIMLVMWLWNTPDGNVCNANLP